MRIVLSLMLVMGLWACGDDDTGTPDSALADATVDATVGDSMMMPPTGDAMPPSGDAMMPPPGDAMPPRPDGMMSPPDAGTLATFCERVVAFYVDMCWSELRPGLMMPTGDLRAGIVSECVAAASACTPMDVARVNGCLTGSCAEWNSCVSGLTCLGSPGGGGS